jgi:hypothetical protein
MENEIICAIYSMKDGNKIKTWNLVEQEKAKEQYREMILNNQDVGYFEGINFPTDNPLIKFNSVKKVFEPKNGKELVNDNIRLLKKYEKIVLNDIVVKQPYEMYQEGIILNNPFEKVFKIDKNNSLKRKNIIELLKENFSEKEIKDGILEKVIAMLDKRNYELRKKYPDFEFLNFDYKTSMANRWNSLSEPAKMRILRSEDRLNSFNILVVEFYSSLSEEDKNNNEVILNKMNELVAIILEKEKIFKENYAKLLAMRNFFTGKLRDMLLNESSINSFLNEVNSFYGEEILKAEEIELTAKYYSTIPSPDLNFYK